MSALHSPIRVEVRQDEFIPSGLTSPQDEELVKRKRGPRLPSINLYAEDDLGTTTGYSESGGSLASSQTFDTQGPVAREVCTRLNALAPVHLNLINDSAAHAGHAGAVGFEVGESHFKVHVVSEHFEGKNLVARHQIVYGALGDLMATKIHAMNIKAQTPKEFHGCAF